MYDPRVPISQHRWKLTGGNREVGDRDCCRGLPVTDLLRPQQGQIINYMEINAFEGDGTEPGIHLRQSKQASSAPCPFSTASLPPKTCVGMCKLPSPTQQSVIGTHLFPCSLTSIHVTPPHPPSGACSVTCRLSHITHPQPPPHLHSHSNLLVLDPFHTHHE